MGAQRPKERLVFLKYSDGLAGNQRLGYWIVGIYSNQIILLEPVFVSTHIIMIDCQTSHLALAKSLQPGKSGRFSLARRLDGQ